MRVYRTRHVARHLSGRAGESGQTLTEYVTLLGLVVLATIGMLGVLMPFTRLSADLVRRLVLDLSS